MNLNPSTQLAILRDLIEVLDRQGVKKLLLLNSHGGNDFKTALRELGLKFPDMFLCTASWFKALNKEEYFELPGDHADEMETSLILHMAPGLVLDRDQWGEGQERKNKIASFREGWLWAERPWSQATVDTGVGDPRKASAEKGARYFDAVTDKIGKAIFDIANADTNSLYE